MLTPPDGLWLSANPGLKQFDWPLLKRLNHQVEVHSWDYSQSPDEPCDLVGAIALLHDYMQGLSRPIHLLGHSLSGILALMYARQYPEYVQSLTLLSVGAEPQVSWHSHYYVLRNLLHCDRTIVLRQMVRLLFGACPPIQATHLVKILGHVLDKELAPHSLTSHEGLVAGGVRVPLLVCHGEQDVILDPNSQIQWNPFLKPGDHRWQCPEGRHFFHHEYPKLTSQKILDFWQQPICQSSAGLLEQTL
ncbi:MAG: alpha/beta hydrolase [Cyanobacteria bacterium P01_D01_bin.6]